MADEKWINFLITSSGRSNEVERRFQDSTVIADLKNKLEIIVGAMSSTMTIQLFDKDNKLMENELNDERTLKSYEVVDGWRLHVVTSTPPIGGGNDDDGTVEKFEISEDAYAKRGDSVRSWMAANKLGKFDPDREQRLKEQAEEKLAAQQRLADGMKLGDRCEVRPKNGPSKRGTIRFLGATRFQTTGLWVGVEYDEPVGKNNGTVDGEKYFECADKYGGFARPDIVFVGDYPPLFSEDELLDDL